jgi:hypothetical protein
MQYFLGEFTFRMQNYANRNKSEVLDTSAMQHETTTAETFRSRSTERQQEAELQVVSEPGLSTNRNGSSSSESRRKHHRLLMEMIDQ